jgi:two-component system phosphate regulon sensor histidine kinase PhoR
LTNKTIQRVIILGTIAIAGIMGIQSYWIYTTWQLRSTEFDQKVQIALRKTAEDLADLNETILPSEDLIRQQSTDYYLVNINNVFAATDLEFFLKQELEALSIHDDFDYYIYDCGSDNMVFCNYVDYGSERTDEIKVEMPKSPDLIYYFGVRFPNRVGFLLNTLWLAILFSVLLLIAITFFGYSMSVILRQKRDSELQKDFINNMTHEFKTPISTIKISGDVFLNDPVIKEDKRLLQYATIIKEQNDRLSSHVDKVLNVARIEKEGLDMKMEAFELNALIQKAWLQVMPNLEQMDGECSINTDVESIPLKGDIFHLEHVFMNVFDNAVKYSEDRAEINISVTDEGRHWKVIISDNGIGIPKDQQDTLFDKFYRVPTGNIHNVKGFGLGLYYVKHICEQHGWDINIESKLGEGTEVTFNIPKMK